MHSTAGELWRTWTDGKVLQPEHYDRDVADLVRAALGSASSSGLAGAMDAARWTPRQLLHAIAPALVSFSGMMQDLLTLYAKIGARSGTGDNLLLRYEFTEDDPFDQLLSHFRDQATLARTASRAAVPLAFH
ncbi:MAG: hypothetical protein JO144_14500, partial [Actinobacteria bacterium]|nr:hypothetical protein [Actinomycetota bacterium]